MTHTTFRLLALFAGAACLAAAGCGPGYELVPVSGQVTWQGEPLAGWGVQFQPISDGPASPGPGSHGTTDAEGRHTLHLVAPDRPGAVVGRHRVRITPPGAAEEDPLDDLGDPQAIQPPPHFLDGSIEFTVPRGGTGEAEFHLQAAPVRVWPRESGWQGFLHARLRPSSACELLFTDGPRVRVRPGRFEGFSAFRCRKRLLQRWHTARARSMKAACTHKREWQKTAAGHSKSDRRPWNQTSRRLRPDASLRDERGSGVRQAQAT